MPSAEYSKTVEAPFDRVWRFVRDMDHWAPLLTGYQHHEKVSDTESIWKLKGELGGLTRVAEFRVLITEWDENGRVRFALEGLSEPVTGAGLFIAAPLKSAEAPPSADQGQARPILNAFTAIRDSIARLLLKFVFRQTSGKSPIASSASARTAESTQLIFSLSLNATGMAGGVLNVLLAPMLGPVAADLAENIAVRILSS